MFFFFKKIIRLVKVLLMYIVMFIILFLKSSRKLKKNHQCSHLAVLINFVYLSVNYLM